MELQALGNDVWVDKNNLTYFKVILANGFRQIKLPNGQMKDQAVVIRMGPTGKMENPNEWPLTPEQVALIKKWHGDEPRILKPDDRLAMGREGGEIPGSVIYPDINVMIEAFENDAKSKKAIFDTPTFQEAVAAEVRKIMGQGDGSLAKTFIDGGEDFDLEDETGDEELADLQKELADEPDTVTDISGNGTAKVGAVGGTAGGRQSKAGAGAKKGINGSPKAGSKKSGK